MTKWSLKMWYFNAGVILLYFLPIWVYRRGTLPNHTFFKKKKSDENIVNASVHHVNSYQTCYITSPHGKGVQEQHYFSVCPSIRHPSIYSSCYLLLNHWAEFNQTCYITSPHGKGVQAQHYFSVCASVHASLPHTISSKSTEQNSTKLVTSFPLMGSCRAWPVYWAGLVL